MKTFEINGKRYNSAPFTFNMVCEFEESGIQLQDIGKKPFAVMRAYFSICSGLSMELAGKEMEQHVINGGTFDKIMEIMKEEIEKSDFFRANTKTEETETGTGK